MYFNDEFYFRIVPKKGSMKNASGFYEDGGMKKRYLEEEFQKWRRLQSSHPTDIPTREEDEVEAERRWQCGNTRKRKMLCDNFIEKSSVHGLSHMCQRHRNSFYTILFYRTLFVVSMVLVTVNMVFLLREKLSRESTFINSINKDIVLGMQEDPKYFPQYPKITVCSQPPYNTDFNASYLEIVEYAFLALNYPFVVLTPDQVSLIIQVIQHVASKGEFTAEPRAFEFQEQLVKLENRLQVMKKNDTGFNLKKFVEANSIRCEDFFSSCTIMVFTLRCCDVFKPVFTTLGLCYKLVEVQRITELIHEVPLDISLVLDLYSPPKTGKATQEGFLVFLSDPLDDTFELKDTDGKRVLPGSVTSITTELIKLERSALYTPWHGLTNYCPQMPPEIQFKDDPDRFSSLMCSNYYVNGKLKDNCDCESILEPGVPVKRYCEPKDMYNCFIITCLKNNLSDIDEMCKLPCISYSYKSEASYVGLGTPNITRIDIMYNPHQYVSYEYRTTTLSGLFSQIGGALGLYLGASIITMVEIVVFCFSWIWYKMGPNRRPATVIPKLHSSRKATSRH